MKLYDRQDEILGLIEGIENLVLCDCDGVRTSCPALDLKEAKAALVRDETLDVVAQLLPFAVKRYKAQPTLNVHHNRASLRGDSLIVHCAAHRRRWFARDCSEQSERNHQ